MDPFSASFLPSESSLLVETPAGCLVAVPAVIGASPGTSSPPSRRKRRDRAELTSSDSMEMISRFRRIIDISDSTVRQQPKHGETADAVQRLIFAVEKLQICKLKRTRRSTPVSLQEILKSLDQMQLSLQPLNDEEELCGVLEKLQGLLRIGDDEGPATGKISRVS